MNSRALVPASSTSLADAAAAEVAEQTVNLCVFQVGRDEMALDIMRIREIMRPPPMTPVPRAPLGVRGLIHVRGTVIPVVDLRERFALPRAEDHAHQRIMVTLERRKLYGLLVDRVDQVARIPRSAVQAGGDVLAGVAAHVFSGVCTVEDRMVLLLNLQRLLAVDQPISLPMPSARGGKP